MEGPVESPKSTNGEDQSKAHHCTSSQNEDKINKTLEEESTSNVSKNSEPVNEVLVKQRSEVQEYRRRQHEKWRKRRESSPKKQSPKVLSKDVDASLSSIDVVEVGSVCASEDTGEAKTPIERSCGGKNTARRRRRRNNKRMRLKSESDKVERKRKNCGPSTAAISESTLPPVIVDVDGETSPRPPELTDNEAVDMEIVQTDEEGIVPTEMPRKERPRDRNSRTHTPEGSDEEIVCLGVYSKPSTIDLTNSPVSDNDTEEHSKPSVSKPGKGKQKKHSARSSVSIPRSSESPSFLEPPHESCSYAIGSNPAQNHSALTPANTNETFVNSVPPHAYPWAPRPLHPNQPSPAFANFMAAASFGNAIFPRFDLPELNPGVYQGTTVPDFANFPALPSAFSHADYGNVAPCSTAMSYSSSRRQKTKWRPMLRNRAWSPILDTVKSADVMDFTVMSYNVLAQHLLENHRHLYRGSSGGHLTWDYRSQNLLQEISEYMPDIICLQEVKADHYFDFFLPRLSTRGYQGNFKCKTRSMEEGCAIFYKDSKFTLEKATPVEFHVPNAPNLDRDNIALILTLVPRVSKETDAKLLVATTHLLFNPKRGDVKLAQLMVLMSEIDKLAWKDITIVPPDSPNYHPTILTGDFNSEPRSQLYRFLATGRVNYENCYISDFSGQDEGLQSGNPRCFTKEVIPRTVGISDQCKYLKEIRSRLNEWNDYVAGVPRPSRSIDEELLLGQSTGALSISLPLVSVYRHSNFSSRSNSYEREVTTHHSRSNSTVDYIFYSVHSRTTKVKEDRVIIKKVQEDKLRLIRRLTLLSEREMKKAGPLPNEEVSSDHVALLAEFQLSV